VYNNAEVSFIFSLGILDSMLGILHKLGIYSISTFETAFHVLVLGIIVTERRLAQFCQTFSPQRIKYIVKSKNHVRTARMQIRFLF